MRVALVSAADPRDRRTWSGVTFYMASALKKQFGNVDIIGPMPIPMQKLKDRIARVTFSISGKRVYPSRTKRASLFYSKEITQRLSAAKYDLIFAPAASPEIAFLETGVPIVYLSDATFSQMHDIYTIFSSLSRKTIANERLFERSAIKRSQLIVYPSKWAANSAIRDYEVDKDKVKVIPFGANIDHIPARESVTGKTIDGIVKMLFLAKEWDRKGGEIAFETLKELVDMGVKAELTVCGVVPPAGFSHKSMKVIPYLDKNIPEDLKRLEQVIMESHLLLLPTRIECFGIVFCEANAYGLPVFATDVGGVSSVVKNGENGYLLPLNARGKEYAKIITGIVRDKNAYSLLNRRARDRYEKVLNWDTWGRDVRLAVKESIGI